MVIIAKLKHHKKIDAQTSTNSVRALAKKQVMFRY
jgi:hypothetical protein